MNSKIDRQTAKTVPSIPAAKRASMLPQNSKPTIPEIPKPAKTPFPGSYSFVREWQSDNLE